MKNKRLPVWLRKKIPTLSTIDVSSILDELNLNTVCDAAKCPNRGECFSKRRATFMILGDKCTRNCTFCSVEKSNPTVIDENEPGNIAKAVNILKLKHVVITSVTRDDLQDGGANHFCETIKSIHTLNPEVSIEVLIPDFLGNENSLRLVCSSGISILNHNLETIERLYPELRAMANYSRSLDVLRNTKAMFPNLVVKSGIMVGVGETYAEVLALLDDLRSVGCDLVTIGQYLSPSGDSYKIDRFVEPSEFDKYVKYGEKIGLTYVSAAPFVRSSYNAEEVFSELSKNKTFKKHLKKT